MASLVVFAELLRIGIQIFVDEAMRDDRMYFVVGAPMHRDRYGNLWPAQCDRLISSTRGFGAQMAYNLASAYAPAEAHAAGLAVY